MNYAINNSVPLDKECLHTMKECLAIMKSRECIKYAVRKWTAVKRVLYFV